MLLILESRHFCHMAGRNGLTNWHNFTFSRCLIITSLPFYRQLWFHTNVCRHFQWGSPVQRHQQDPSASAPSCRVLPLVWYSDNICLVFPTCNYMYMFTVYHTIVLSFSSSTNYKALDWSKFDSNNKSWTLPNWKSLQTAILNLMKMAVSYPKG